MYGSSSTSSGAAKDPPVLAAEKYFSCFCTGDANGIYSAMDPKVVLTTPMGIFHGRPHVKGWLAFEHSIIARVGAKMEGRNVRGEAEGSKSAVVTWSVGALHFTDVVVINQVHLIKSIKRTWVKTQPKDDATKALTAALLLAWTGPHFEKYCAPKTTIGIDRKALTLPVLDFSFCNITKARDILTTAPRDGKTLTERDVVLHYLESVQDAKREKAKQADEKPKGGGAANDASTKFGTGAKKEEITIRAKNRDGDQGAIVIDRNALANDASNSKSAVDSLEDGEVAVNEDRIRYVGSSLKLSNNSMTNARELDQVLRLVFYNAFYFLTWIDLSTNRLDHIPDLTTFPILVLYLHDNDIKDWNEVKKLTELPQLQTLTLFGNPIQATASSAKEYKFKALTAIKGQRSGVDLPLRTFDHCVLSPAERENVDRYAAMAAATSRSRPQSRN